MAPKKQAVQSILTGIISSIIAFIQLNVAILNYQADCQLRKRAAPIRLLAMPVSRNAALKRVNKKRQAQRRRFWIRSVLKCQNTSTNRSPNQHFLTSSRLCILIRRLIEGPLHHPSIRMAQPYFFYL